MTANEIIERALAEVGTKENPPNSNKVKYNAWYYGKAVSGDAYPWCAAFVSWLFRDCQNLCKKSASCLNMLEWFEINKQIVKKPQKGDIIFFKYGTNNRRTNHVGIVYSVDGGSITTIEGNTSRTSNDNGGSVMKRIRTSNIVAYARPSYTAETKKDYPTLKKGSKNESVKMLKTLLNKYGHNLDVKNDYFGANTELAVIAFQAQKGIDKDGIVGKITWKKLTE